MRDGTLVAFSNAGPANEPLRLRLLAAEPIWVFDEAPIAGELDDEPRNAIVPERRRETCGGCLPVHGAGRNTRFGRAVSECQIAGHTIGAVFMHLGGVVFYYLFSKSKLIPRSLATFAIVAYALVLTGAIVNVVLPGAPANMLTLQDTFNTVCVIPSIVLEVVAGGWLLTKGVAARALDSGTFADRGLIEAEQR